MEKVNTKLSLGIRLPSQEKVVSTNSKFIAFGEIEAIKVSLIMFFMSSQEEQTGTSCTIAHLAKGSGNFLTTRKSAFD